MPRPAQMVLVAAVLVLSGCTTMQTYQADCEKRHQEFVEMTKCLRTVVSADWRGGATDVQLYLGYADALARRVMAGELSQDQARMALIEMHVKIMQAQPAMTPYMTGASMPR